MKKTREIIRLLNDAENLSVSQSAFCVENGILPCLSAPACASPHLSACGDAQAGMIQQAGKMFVCFTDKELIVTDWLLTIEHKVTLFVAFLGASQLTYVEAVESMQSEDWIRVNQNALHFFGGVPQAIVPDRLRYNRQKYKPATDYNDFSKYYDTTILPKPKNPYVESLFRNAVELVYVWISASLKDRFFYYIKDLNAAIKQELEIFNNKPMLNIKVSRTELFEAFEQSMLKPLPSKLYEFKIFIRSKVQFNFHIYLSEDKHYYSVPYKYVSKHVDVIYSKSIVEIYHKDIRIAIHNRDRTPHEYTTSEEHMPPNHRLTLDWNSKRFIKWAENIGPSVKKIINIILKGKGHPEQGYRVCLGILNLAKKYGNNRLNNACQRTLFFKHYSLKALKNILENKLDKKPILEQQLDFYI